MRSSKWPTGLVAFPRERTDNRPLYRTATPPHQGTGSVLCIPFRLVPVHVEQVTCDDRQIDGDAEVVALTTTSLSVLPHSLAILKMGWAEAKPRSMQAAEACTRPIRVLCAYGAHAAGPFFSRELVNEIENAGEVRRPPLEKSVARGQRG